MLDIEILLERGIAILTPKGKLEVSDFERVGREIDPLIETKGELRGLMICAGRFPGWSSFAAFVSHLRFVKDHQRRVRRVAVVSDNAFLRAMPRLASYFAAADIKHFPSDGRDRALAWLEFRLSLSHPDGQNRREQEAIMSGHSSQSGAEGMSRRELLGVLGAAALTIAEMGAEAQAASDAGPVTIDRIEPGEDVLRLYRTGRKAGSTRRSIASCIGAANDFKEGDQAIGVGAADETTRRNARALLANTRIRDLHEHPLLVDDLQRLIWQTTDQAQYAQVKDWTMGQLKEFLLTASETDIKGVMNGLTSDTIGCVPKLMSNEELIVVGQKIFNVVPGTKMGAKGYMGARIQPNSPTDHPDDVVWQVFDAFAYATGDIVIGTNPVDSTVASVAAVEKRAEGRRRHVRPDRTSIPWCVLSHIDVQAEVAERYPGTVATMFQSLAGTDDCNKIFDITIPKIMKYAESKKGERYGLYFETGQGSEFTNGAANGVDMMVLESRKYGFSRAVGAELAKVQPSGAWLHVNDVAGFIGPEVFKTARAAGAVLPGGHRHGQAARPAHRPGRLLDAAHEGEPGGSGLVPGADHAGQSGLPDRAADQERSDAGLPHDLVPGPCPAAGEVRLQGRRRDVGVLPAHRRSSTRTTSIPSITATRCGSTISTGWRRATRGPRTRSTRRARRRCGGRGARRRPRDRSRRADLGSQPAARGQGQRPLRRCEGVALGRADARVRRLHPQCRCRCAPCPATATTTSPIRAPARR